MAEGWCQPCGSLCLHITCSHRALQGAGSGQVQVRGALCTNKGLQAPSGPSAQSLATPGHLLSQAPCRLRQVGPPGPSPALQPPAWAAGHCVVRIAGASCSGCSAASPRDSCLYPHSSHSCGEPCITQPLCPTPQAAKAPQSLPPKCLGPVMDGGAGQGLTVGSVGRSEGCRGGGWLAVAGAGTCGRGRPHCRWCRTRGGTGDLQSPAMVGAGEATRTQRPLWARHHAGHLDQASDDPGYVPASSPIYR